MKRIAITTVTLSLLATLPPSPAKAYPGSCSPATDLQSCLECASQAYQSCASACGSSTDWTCNRECIRELSADRNDCHGQFDPLTY